MIIIPYCWDQCVLPIWERLLSSLPSGHPLPAPSFALWFAEWIFIYRNCLGPRCSCFYRSSRTWTWERSPSSSGGQSFSFCTPIWACGDRSQTTQWPWRCLVSVPWHPACLPGKEVLISRHRWGQSQPWHLWEEHYLLCPWWPTISHRWGNRSWRWWSQWRLVMHWCCYRWQAHTPSQNDCLLLLYIQMWYRRASSGKHF